MMRIIAWIAVVISIACHAGPPPTIPTPAPAGEDDAFPSSSDGPLPLDPEILSGDLDQVRSLLAQRINPNLRWSRRGDRLPIQEVLESPMYHLPIDRPAFLRVLLEAGADPNAKWCPFETRLSPGPGLPGCLPSTAR